MDPEDDEDDGGPPMPEDDSEAENLIGDDTPILDEPVELRKAMRASVASISSDEELDMLYGEDSR
jgi:hypothetical protein